MKYTILVVRILLGAGFVFFGGNKILHFLALPAMTGNAALFMTAMASSGFLKVVALLEIIGGLLLLVGRFVPLALTLLGPVVVSIVLFHVFMAPAQLPLGGLFAVLWLFLLFVYRASFFSLFAPDPLPQTSLR